MVSARFRVAEAPVSRSRARRWGLAGWFVPAFNAALALSLQAGLLLSPQPAGAAEATPAEAAASAPAGKPSSARSRRPRPQLASSAAFDAVGRLWMVGLDDANRLIVRVAPADQPSQFGPVRYLDQVTEPVAADGESRPKIAFGGNGQAVIAWTTPLSRPYTGNIRMIRSTDGGQHFGQPFTVHQDRQLITHRFETIAFDRSGALHVFWIDKRDVEAVRGTRPAGASRGGGHADYRGAAVYRVVSRDGGASFDPDTRLFDHSCECCRIAVAPTPEGGLAALWRHVFEPNERDHAFAVVPPAGAPGLAQPLAGPVGEPGSRSAPVRASFDRWALDACPHHGPGLAPAISDADPAVGWHAVWFGERAGRSAVRYGRLSHDGSPASDAVPLPDDGAEHASIAAVGARVAIVWRSFDGEQTALRAWISNDAGRSFRLRTLALRAGDTDHPLLVQRGDQVHVFWRTRDSILVEGVIP